MPGQKKREATMYDVARASGVSQSTVSMVLGGKWRTVGIAQGTRDRIVETARHLNFRRNGIARRLTAGRTHMLGFVVPHIAGYFFARITFELELEARRREYHVVLCHSYDRRDQELREMELLLEMRVDGIVVAPASDAPAGPLYEELRRHHIPFLFLDSYLDDVAAPFVGTDDLRGGYVATRHLLDRGHRRIAHLAKSQTASSTRARCQGYRRAMAEAGVPAAPEWIADTTANEREQVRGAVAGWLAADPPVTAIFAADDRVAAIAMHTLRAAGKRVPEDVAVVGYGDLYPTEMGLDLTSVRQPTEEIGRQAAGMVIDLAEGKPAEPAQRFLPPRLIVRGSCGAPERSREEDASTWFSPERRIAAEGIGKGRTV